MIRVVSSSSILFVNFKHSIHSNCEYIGLPFIEGWYL